VQNEEHNNGVFLDINQIQMLHQYKYLIYNDHHGHHNDHHYYYY
jgi:hypothetical protein